MRGGPGIITAITAWLLAGGGIVASSLALGPKPDLLIAVLLAQAAVVLPVALLVLRLPAGELGLGRCARRDLGQAMALIPLAAIASFAVLFLTIAFAGPPPPGQAVEQAIHSIHARLGWAGLILLAAVLPGICEEMLFRGVILRGLRRRLPPGWAIVLTALLFAGLHFSPWRFLPQFVLGCILGWLALRSGSCWPAAVVHAGHNAGIVVVAILVDHAVGNR